MRKEQTFLCKGDFQSRAYDRYLDEEGALQVHHLVGGGTLWECHGNPEGDIFTGGQVVRYCPEDVFIACYPSQVGEKQGLKMALPDWDGMVIARFVDLGSGLDGLYLLVVEPD